MSGALPSTSASTSFQESPASSSALDAASRTRPAIDTSWRAVSCLVWPIPITAQRFAIVSSALQHADEVLLQARPGRGVRERAVRLARRDAPAPPPDPD